MCCCVPSHVYQALSYTKVTFNSVIHPSHLYCVFTAMKSVNHKMSILFISAIYLAKRSLRNKQKHALEEYEQVRDCNYPISIDS